MIETIAIYIGYGVLIASGILGMAFLLWLSYIIYGHYLKRLLEWNDPKVRADLFYFIRHKKEIREAIKNA